MTMHTVFFKEHEQGIGQNPMDGAPSAVPRWSLPPAVVYGEAFIGSKLASLELSAGGNGHFCASKESDQDHHAKPNTINFTLFSGGDCKTGENGEKTPLQRVPSVQASTVDYRGHFELGFGQPLICGKYPYPEQFYGIYSTYGTQVAGRMMLQPVSIGSDGGPIYVNAKQYNGIMRRRKKRAEAEIEINKAAPIKMRKPYLHLSRHLHAMRRPRGNGGRFLNTKKSTGKTCSSPKKGGGEEMRENHLTKTFEMVQCDGGGGVNSNSSRSPSPAGSDVSSDHELFSKAFHQHPAFSFHHFSDVGNTAGLGIAMVNNYLKV